MKRILLMTTVVFITTAAADDVQMEMTKAAAMNQSCITTKIRSICEERDDLFSRLRDGGLCFNESRTGPLFNRCSGLEDDRTSGDFYFFIQHRQYLDNSLRACEDIAAAGNAGLAAHCRFAARNAHDFLVDRSHHGTAPTWAWQKCASEIQDDLTLGARCIAAAEEICPVDSNKQMRDANRCMQTMLSGAWITNPRAAALDFDHLPRR